MKRKERTENLTILCMRIKEVNFILYRTVRPVYTIPVSKTIQIPPLFRIGKNADRTDEIWLFRPVNGYWAKTRNGVFFVCVCVCVCVVILAIF